MSIAITMPETRARESSSDGEQLGAEITRLCSHIYAAEARLLNLIRRFDEQKFWQAPGLCSCAHWLNFKCGIGMNAAREKVRVAHALAHLPTISLAFEKGELSYSKVRAMTRIADSSNEDYLLMIAHHGTAHHVEKLVAKFRGAKRAQETELANAQYRDRELTHYYDHDGSLVIKARLPAEQGALIVKALEMAMDKDFAETNANANSDVHPKSTSIAVSSRSAGSASSSNSGDVHDVHFESGLDVYPKGTWTAVTPDEPVPIAARRADALTEIAETYMNNSESSGSTADRYQVVVHVTDDAHIEDGPYVYPEGTWTAVTPHSENGPHVPSGQTSRDCAGEKVASPSWHDTDDAHIEDGPHVTAVTSRRIACDSSVVRVREDQNGVPLSIGRRSRSIPPPMRRALRLRDGGCRFPGCTNSRFVDGHHIKHWADGGETSLDNLVMLCRQHHRLVHEGGFDCVKTADGDILFRDQRARPLADWSALPGVADHQEIQAWLDREFLEADIDSETCTARWYAGERIDWDMAVAALF